MISKKHRSQSLINRSYVIFSLLALCLVAFQNCAKGFEVSEGSVSPFYQATKDCFASSLYEACLFQKNVVAQAGSSVAADNANQYQSVGVKLSELTSPSVLASPSFVLISNGTNAKKVDGTWKFNFYTNTDELAQVSAYYFLTDFKNYFKKTTGIFYAENQAIKVVTDSSFSAYSASFNEISLETNDEKIPAALDAGLVVNLLAHANAYFASSGQALTNQATSTQACYNKKSAYVPYACCKTAQGCGPAILAGQADYLTAVYFTTTSTAIGESWTQDPSGLSTCGVSRDVAKNAALNSNAAYSACASFNSEGNIYTMGALYSSIWWESRKRATDKNNFDLFFMKHLAVIRGDDTFLTIQTKLQILDNAQFGGMYYSNIQSEFQKRGY